MSELIALVTSPIFWIYVVILAANIVLLIRFCFRKETPTEDKQGDSPENTVCEFSEHLKGLGYIFDSEQGIFTAAYDAWQREYGYCKIYDDAMVSLGIVADCEPVTFSFQGREYMIEMWKGQYGPSVGGEIGVFVDSGEDLSGNRFYRCAVEDEMLQVSFTLFNGYEGVFSRSGRHWWLNGFVMGEFANPSALTMVSVLTFPCEDSASAYLEALYSLGYDQGEAYQRGSCITVFFTEPKTPQPLARTGFLAGLTQEKNRKSAEEFKELLLKGMSTKEGLCALNNADKPVYFSRPRELFDSFGPFEKG